MVPTSDSILFIAIYNPFESGSGAQQRTAMLFRTLCKLGHVDLVCFTDDPLPAQMNGPNYSVRYFGSVGKQIYSRKHIIARKLKIWSPYFAYPRVNSCTAIVKNILDQTNYKYIVMRYLESVFLCGLYHRKDLIVDVDDLPEQKFRSYYLDKKLRLRARVFYFYTYWLSKRFIDRFFADARHLFFSNSEHCGPANASYLPNIPFPDNIPEEISTHHSENPTIIFVGTMSYLPNWMGVDMFIQHVWQKVLRAIPDARFKVIGGEATTSLRLKWEQTPGVEVRGYVKDVSKEYEHCMLVIAPIYHGAGTNIKVLEAMAMQRSCVATEYTARGHGRLLEHRKNILIARSYDEFADAIIELIRHPELNDYIRKHAAKTIKDHFSASVFEEYLKKGLGL